MARGTRKREQIGVPAPVAEWVRVMSRRAHAPAHRILEVLVNEYMLRLSPGLKRRLTEALDRTRRGGDPH